MTVGKKNKKYEHFLPVSRSIVNWKKKPTHFLHLYVYIKKTLFSSREIVVGFRHRAKIKHMTTIRAWELSCLSHARVLVFLTAHAKRGKTLTLIEATQPPPCHHTLVGSVVVISTCHNPGKRHQHAKTPRSGGWGGWVATCTRISKIASLRGVTEGFPTVTT